MTKFLVLIAGVVLLAGCNMPGTGAPTTNEDQSMVEDTATSGAEGVDDGAMEGSGDTTMEQSVQLDEQNNSGQNGTATFKEVDGKVVVTLAMEGKAYTTPQPAHIHVGRCPSPGAVKYPLTNVVGGMSETTLDIDMATLWQDAANLAVNVHKSADEVKVYTACGNLGT